MLGWKMKKRLCSIHFYALGRNRSDAVESFYKLLTMQFLFLMHSQIYDEVVFSLFGGALLLNPDLQLFKKYWFCSVFCRAIFLRCRRRDG